jgi:Bacteriocin-protection, YdeI or OmpD-Associated
MIQNLLEKIQLKDEKNLLIQGLPSSIEKQFAKLSFAKNVTPLLKSRKIDFALIFAINEKQLNAILGDVIPALQSQAKLWIAYPKKASKIVTDLDRESSWLILEKSKFESVLQITLDHVWIAARYKKIGEDVDTETPDTKGNSSAANATAGVNYEDRTILLPEDLETALKEHKEAQKAFDTLSFTNKREFVEWIVGAKKEVTKQKRLKDTIDKLVNGKKNPSEK